SDGSALDPWRTPGIRGYRQFSLKTYFDWLSQRHCALNHRGPSWETTGLQCSQCWFLFDCLECTKEDSRNKRYDVHSWRCAVGPTIVVQTFSETTSWAINRGRTRSRCCLRFETWTK